MTDGIKAPWLLLGIVGSILGLLLACGFHVVSASLRRAQPLPLAFVGWLSAIALASVAVYLIYPTLSRQDVTGISLGIGVVLLLILAVVAALAVPSARRDGIKWFLAFGHLMALATLAGLFIYTVAQYLPYLAAFLHGGKPSDSDMIHWFPPVHFAADWMYGTLLVGVVLLEILRPFRNLFSSSS